MEVKFDNIHYSGLQKLSFEMKKNMIHAIIGDEDKSLILKIIDGLIIPEVGIVSIGDSPTNKKEIGIVFENPAEMFFNKTVKKELEFSLKMHNYRLKEKDKYINNALKLVGLNETLLNMSPFEISSGEKKKLALAMTLICNPKLILLDNPTKGLDNLSKINLIKLIRLLKNKYHKTIIIASDDTDFLYKFVDNVYVFKNKKIVLSGTKKEIFTNIEEMNKYKVRIPEIIKFTNYVNTTKKLKLKYRDDINDLLKDVYRYV